MAGKNADTSPSAQAAMEKMMSIYEDWQSSGLDAWAWANPAWFQQMIEINAELTHFVGQRLKEDVQTQSEILQCRDPAELREIQARFVKTAFDQYTAESGKLVRMGQEAFERMTGRVTGG